jgi:hypothetical protein
MALHYGRGTQLFHELIVEVLDAAFLYTYLEYLSRVALKSSSCLMAAMKDNIVSFFNQPRQCRNVRFVYFSSLRRDASLLTAF